MTARFGNFDLALNASVSFERSLIVITSPGFTMNDGM